MQLYRTPSMGMRLCNFLHLRWSKIPALSLVSQLSSTVQAVSPFYLIFSKKSRSSTRVEARSFTPPQIASIWALWSPSVRRPLGLGAIGDWTVWDPRILTISCFPVCLKLPEALADLVSLWRWCLEKRSFFVSGQVLLRSLGGQDSTTGRCRKVDGGLSM
ncbi:hypothetical protein RchiOBHm_Chr7g0197261 [Rosa chinensis]|uniref:Uncharacterized protein n=1 Tax=Rosa chinensis TaxID=74649 RepID=A0A2P6P6V0_ROSCH|nr:hypothetical protein RchiOBHm_Chr7g0197261 [Rosa chinensis]